MESPVRKQMRILWAKAKKDTQFCFFNRRKRSAPSTPTVVKLINTLQKLACRREQGLAAASRQQESNKHKEASFRGMLRLPD
jgi:hypothetical protein